MKRWARTIAVFLFVLVVGVLVQLVAENMQGSSAEAAATSILLGVAFFTGAVGVCTATLGWYFFRQADAAIARRIDKALVDFRRRLAVEQARHDEARKHLINGYSFWFDRQDLDAAIAQFEQAVRAYPHGLGGYVALGYAYYSRGDTDKAFELFNKALTLYPDRKEPYRDIAGLLIREGDLVRAMEYVERAVQVDPSVRRDLLEDPLFDILKHEERTRDRYERVIHDAL